MKLARSFLAALVALIVVVLGFAALITLQEERELFDADTHQDHAALGRAVAASVRDAWDQRGEAGAREAVAAATDAEAPGGSIRLDLAKIPDDMKPYETRVRGSRIETFAPVEGRPLAVLVSESRAQRDVTLRRSWGRWGIFGVVLAVAASAVVLVLGMALIARPMTRLVGHARRIGAGDLTPNEVIDTENEIGELADEMNGMCLRLAEARERLTRETERRIATLEQLRHADRLGTVGQLAAGVAHELGTPLNVVQGRAQLVLEDETAGAVAHQNAKTIVDQVDRMARIIRQLLDFARRGAGPDGGAEATCNPVVVARKTADLLKTMAKRNGVALKIPEDESQLSVPMDGALLAQVVANLTVNAIHASQDRGGTVGIEVKTEQTARPPGTTESRGPFAAIVVRDEGVGIGAEDLPRIFEPFFTTKDVGQGTGLGLSVSYGIVRDHGGWIDVASTVGRGSTFTVHLPLRASQDGQGAPGAKTVQTTS